MKKRNLILALGCCLALGTLCFGSEAEEGLKIETRFEKDSFIIEIPVEEGDLGWAADDSQAIAPFVKLGEQGVTGDTFVARYDAVVDGMVTVAVRHYYTGFACDHALTFDLKVRDGAVQEVVGGSEAQNVPEEELDPYLSGEWREEGTQFTELSITKGQERGWDVVLVSPLTQEGLVFKTTIYQDCEKGFVYDKGKFWDLPTDWDGTSSLGEAKTAGTTGCFALEEAEEGLRLTWEDDERSEAMVFEKMEEE